ncbi:hypothetical protein LTR70_000924 [Exophiala xenobiotica]|nr:hypothetical protein LTR70_000924 [Exophiala xenobiotica]
MDAALALPLASGFGQLKWIMLRRKSQPLPRMQQLDLASRSAAGSISLLLSLQGGFIGSVGAIIAVLMLAVGPFAQQVLKVSLDQSFSMNASIGRAMNATEYVARSGSYVTATLPMRSAMYNAIFGFSTNGSLSDPPFSCPTGNCTWDPFLTLGVCSECTNITNLLHGIAVNSDEEFSSIWWTLPTQYNNLSVQGWVNYDSHPYTTMNITSLQEWGWGPSPNDSFLHIGLVNNSLANATEATALDCKLRLCLHKIEAEAHNGQIAENKNEVEGKWQYVDYGTDSGMVLTPNEPESNHTSFFVNDWFSSVLGHTIGELINGTATTTSDSGMTYESDVIRGTP